MVARYSGTPLPKKLGISAGSTVAVLDPPSNFADMLGPLPDGVKLRRTVRGKCDVIVAFLTERRRFEQRIATLELLIFPAGGLWIAWPKRSSGVATDMNGDVVREVALPRGLVDNKVCALDDTWSGLRLVWSRGRR